MNGQAENLRRAAVASRVGPLYTRPSANREPRRARARVGRYTTPRRRNNNAFTFRFLGTLPLPFAHTHNGNNKQYRFQWPRENHE